MYSMTHVSAAARLAKATMATTDACAWGRTEVQMVQENMQATAAVPAARSVEITITPKTTLAAADASASDTTRPQHHDLLQKRHMCLILM